MIQMYDQSEKDSLQILLVEDNPTDVLLIEDALERISNVKIKLTHVNRLDAALARLKAEDFDVVLLDLRLPDSLGLETLTRTQNRYPSVPILVVSELEDETLALAAVRGGAQDYLFKGKLDNIMLARTIRYAIERKRTVEKITASELNYRRLFETAHDGIFLLDAVTGRITDANPFLEELLGYSKVEFIGKRLWEVGAFRDKAASKAAFQTLQEKGYICYEDLPLETKDGRKISVEFVSNIYDVGDKQVIQCNIRDIGERKRAEEAVQDATLFLHATLNALSSHIAVLNETGTIIAVNRAWERFAEENDGSSVAC
ncbi:MAG: PAS domain S-box protein, partial [Abditibacteriaceae bacterium]